MRFPFIYLLLVLVIWVLPVSSQDLRKSFSPQDLVGEWELISSIPGDRTGRGFESGQLRITIRDVEVTIFRRLDDSTQSRERTLIYFVDGRGELNKAIGDDGRSVTNRKTKTTWNKGVLTTRWNYKTSFGWIDVEEAYRLSDDLQELEYRSSQKGSTRMGPEFPETRMNFRRL